MVDPGDVVLVAVSGGQDSLALLHVLSDLRAQTGISLRVAHLDHGIRGESSAADAAFVAELCAQWELPCDVGFRDVPALAAEGRVSLEQAARRARYEFLRQSAAEHGCGKIAVGHTASDSAETVLLNLLRGTGLRGLRGIPAVNGGLIRPLILAQRRETAEYCAACGLQFREDETNLDVEGNVRNRVRLQLLPLLRDAYAPGVDDALVRLAAAAQVELQWTEGLVEEAFRAARVAGADLTLSLRPLQKMPAGLRCRVLMRALEELCGSLVGVKTAHVEALEGLVMAGHTGAQASLPFEVRAQRGYNNIVMSRASRPAAFPSRWEVTLPVPGSALLPGGGVMEACVEPFPANVKASGPCEAFLSQEAAASGLGVRTWLEGDRMQPLGMSGSRKLQDLFVDAKVPRQERHTIPVVVDGEGRIVWVAGLRIAGHAALRAPAAECVHLVWRRQPHRDTSSRGT
jgi:tRNA(Ile)-lysidine synthase